MCFLSKASEGRFTWVRDVILPASTVPLLLPGSSRFDKSDNLNKELLERFQTHLLVLSFICLHYWQLLVELRALPDNAVCIKLYHFEKPFYSNGWARIAQLILRLATAKNSPGSISCECEIFCSRPDWSWDPLSLL